ncbi:MAG: hypothetical protein C4521_08530 [Actinobacteria bacterium]|nr:MAG: hypothetical protein C4521_08530 [Actinomycetota bacterium]
MTRPAFHIENIFDVLNPQGTGVNGFLKLKAIQLQDRVAALARDGDVLALSDYCEQSYLDYLFGLTGAANVLPLRYSVSADLRHYINARTVFDRMKKHPDWPKVLERDPVLVPYLPSVPLYKQAREAGLKIPRGEWKTVVADRLVDQMNDKGVFYRQCDELGLPLPKHWYVDAGNLKDRVLAILRKCPRLYIRVLRSSGAFGNVSIRREGRGPSVRYTLEELGKHDVSRDEFGKTLDTFVRSTHWHEFVISELLDLYASPGTSFAAGASGIQIICHAHQRLTDSRRFFGLIYPINDEKISKYHPAIERAIHLLIEPWRQKGFRGYGDVDWMVTPEGEMFIAELNARQTAAMPAIHIENRLSGLSTGPIQSGEGFATPRLAMVTGDRIALRRGGDFEDVRHALYDRNLLWEQRDGEGIVIYVPPVGGEHKTVGILSLAGSAERAYRLYARAESLLGSFEGKPLFEPAIEARVA